MNSDDHPSSPSFEGLRPTLRACARGVAMGVLLACIMSFLKPIVGMLFLTIAYLIVTGAAMLVLNYVIWFARSPSGHTKTASVFASELGMTSSLLALILTPYIIVETFSPPAGLLTTVASTFTDRPGSDATSSRKTATPSPTNEEEDKPMGFTYTLTFNVFALVACLSIVLDLIALYGLARAIFNEEYSDLPKKVGWTLLLFLFGMILFSVALHADDVAYPVNLDHAVYLCGVGYFCLSCYCVLLVSYILFSTAYALSDFLMLLVVIAVPYGLGVAINAMLYGTASFVYFGAIYAVLALVHGVFCCKNYVLNRTQPREAVPIEPPPVDGESVEVANVMRSQRRNQTTDYLQWFRGKTYDNDLQAIHCYMEAAFFVIIFQLGLLLLFLNETRYIQNVTAIFGLVGG